MKNYKKQINSYYKTKHRVKLVCTFYSIFQSAHGEINRTYLLQEKIEQGIVTALFPMLIQVNWLPSRVQEEISFYSILVDNRVDVVVEEEHTSPGECGIFVTWY